MQDKPLFRFDLERYVEADGHAGSPDAWLVVQTGEFAGYDYDRIVRRYVEAQEIPGRYRVVIFGEYGASLYEAIATARTEWEITRRDLKAPAPDEVEA
jgi:hypothetical protein